jgi:hypothetical protein
MLPRTAMLTAARRSVSGIQQTRKGVERRSARPDELALQPPRPPRLPIRPRAIRHALREPSSLLREWTKTILTRDMNPSNVLRVK